MTRTTQTFIDLVDLQAIYIKCDRCPTGLSLSLKDLQAIPPVCPNCGRPWGQPHRNSPPTGHYVKGFAETLAALQNALADSAGVNFTLKLEVESCTE